MNFFKQAEALAAANTGSANGSNPGAPPASEGGLGSLMGQAQTLFSQHTTTSETPATGTTTTTTTQAAVVSTAPGHHAPTTKELLASSQLLFGAAQGQKVDNSQLSGAAGNVLGGLSAYGKLDQTQYGTYVTQAENFLQKHGQQNVPAPHGLTADMGTHVAPTTNSALPSELAHPPALDGTAPPQ